MNERIRELYLQAHMVRKYPDDHPTLGGQPPTVYWGERSPEKFAELIVRECIERIKRVGILEDIENETDMVVDAVKEHFGVKL